MSTPSVTHPRTRWRFAIVFGLVGALLVAVLVTAFIWPAATSSPKDLPVGISGPDRSRRRGDRCPGQAGPIADGSGHGHVARRGDRQDPAPRDLRRDPARRARGAHRQRREPRRRAGACAGSPPSSSRSSTRRSRPRSSASSRRSAQALASGQQPTLPPAGQATGELPKVTVTDVVPLADSDPTGAGIAAAAFPLTLGGMLGGILLSLLVAGAVRRLVGLPSSASQRARCPRSSCRPGSDCSRATGCSTPQRSDSG